MNTRPDITNTKYEGLLTSLTDIPYAKNTTCRCRYSDDRQKYRIIQSELATRAIIYQQSNLTYKNHKTRSQGRDFGNQAHLQQQWVQNRCTSQAENSTNYSCSKCYEALFNSPFYSPLDIMWIKLIVDIFFNFGFLDDKVDSS